MQQFILVFSMVAVLPIHVFAFSGDESQSLRAVISQYIDGWYEGKCEKMETAIHPDLSKRTVVKTGAGDRLEPMNGLALLQYCRNGEGKKTPVDKRRKEIRVLEIHDGWASASLRAHDFVDHLHLAKFNGKWTIINVLWHEAQPR